MRKQYLLIFLFWLSHCAEQTPPSAIPPQIPPVEQSACAYTFQKDLQLREVGILAFTMKVQCQESEAEILSKLLSIDE